jgi:hypothetical protein
MNFKIFFPYAGTKEEVAKNEKDRNGFNSGALLYNNGFCWL